MALRNVAQLAFDEEVIDDAAIEAALEEREKRKASLAAVRAEFKEAHEAATTAIAVIKLAAGSAARIGRFRITRTVVAARAVSFETEESSRLSISLVEDAAPAARRGWDEAGVPEAAGAVAARMLGEEADLRPTGDVNPDALRGEAERSVAAEPTPLRPRRTGNGRAQPPAPLA
jgi:hypothetical protein